LDLASAKNLAKVFGHLSMTSPSVEANWPTCDFISSGPDARWTPRSRSRRGCVVRGRGDASPLTTIADVPAIDDLVALVPPPAEPVDAQGDWRWVEASLGVLLPADFKALIERYGSGMFVDFIRPCTPFGSRASLVQRARDLLDDMGPVRDNWPDRFPYPFHPEPGGLLEWADTDIGDRLCWVTEGPSDSWQVVVWPRHSDDYAEYAIGAVEFLYSWLRGSITSSVFLQHPEPVPWFEPFREVGEIYVGLAGGEQPYASRLQILREALAPTVDRGGWYYGDDDDRQDKFAAVHPGWRLMYETHDGRQTIRVAYPPGDEHNVRDAIVGAVSAMGCSVLSITKAR
jgi:hypothetical protein